MTKYGSGYSLLRAGASTDVYQYIPFDQAQFSLLKIVFENKHTTNAILYKIQFRMHSAGNWKDEYPENTLVALDSIEIDIDSNFPLYRVGYKSAVPSNHSDNIDIDLSGRTG